jgi:hypothetical protein
MLKTANVDWKRRPDVMDEPAEDDTTGDEAEAQADSDETVDPANS